MNYVLKNTKIFLIFIFMAICFETYSINVYEEYNKAKAYYIRKDYSKARVSLEKTLSEFPEYKEANLLYFKLQYELKEFKDADKALEKVLDFGETIKKELFDYLLLKKDEKRLEKVYLELFEKDSVFEDFTKFLYENKKYSKIKLKYPNPLYLKIMEKDKNSADEKYYKALDFLKKNKISESIKLLEEATKLYPENYIYYYKLGQVYADNRNYYLAELNLTKALDNNNNNNRIYKSLLRLYKEIENYDKYWMIKKKLKTAEKNIHNMPKKLYVKIIKIENNRLYLDNTFLPKMKVGDSSILSIEKERIEDLESGEKLAVVEEKVAKIRYIKLKEKISIFYISEGYMEIGENMEFIFN